MRRRSTRLVGREREFAALDDALEALVDGTPSTVVLVGDAGVGKTRIVDEFVARAPTVRALRGGCVDLAGGPAAYAPWTEIVWWRLHGVSDADVDRLVGANRRHLARLVPALGPADEVTADGQHALFEAVVDLLAHAEPDAPLVVIVEDVHWIDPASADLLRYVATSLRRAPMLLIVTVRADEITPELRELLTRLDRTGGTRLNIAPLSRAEATEVTAALLERPPESDEVALVVDRSEGNPLFLEELAAASDRAALPDSVRDLLLARFSRLDPDAKELVRTAAVIGPHAPRRLLGDVAQFAADADSSSARAAVDAGVLVVDPDAEAYGFHHALLREAVLQDLLPDERIAIHRRIARAVEHAGATDPDAVSDLARHSDAGELGPEALRWNMRAAEQELARYAYRAALAHYERVLAWWPRVADADGLAGTDHIGVLVAASEAARYGNLSDRAVALGTQALDEARPHDLARAADIAATLSSHMWEAGRPDYVEMAEWAVDAARTSGSDHLARHLTALAHAVDGTRAVAVAEEAVELADGDAAARSAALEARGLAQVQLGRYSASVADLIAALADARVAGEPFLTARVMYNIVATAIDIPDFDTVARYSQMTSGFVATSGFAGFGSALRLLDAQASLYRGDVDDARARLAVADAEPSGGYPDQIRVIAHGELARYTGELESTAPLPASDDESTPDDERIADRLEWLHAEQEFWSGEYAAAASTARRALARVGARFELRDVFALLSVAASALAEVARTDESALPALDDIAQTTHSYQLDDAPWHAATAAFIDGESARARARDTPEMWRAALARADTIGIPYDQVLCLWRLADCLARHGDKAEARDAFADGHARAEKIQARHLVRVLADGAGAVGLRLGAAPRPLVGDGFSLSAREIEVLELVREGSTNPEIAERLFIGRRTVRAHLSNIYTKLGVTNRTEAVTVARRRGFID